MISIGVVMDPISAIHIKKDTTFAMLLAAQSKGWEIHYMEPHDLTLIGGVVLANMSILSVQDNPNHWYTIERQISKPLHQLDCILMRKDPPVDNQYLYTTYLLELAQQQGTLVVNTPQGLRDANEKLLTTWFPECCPPCIVTQRSALIKEFLTVHHDIIIKPLHGMGGESIFRVKKEDPNINVIIETVTHHGQHFAMAQRYIPEIAQGDKRILLINGKPIPYALARLPAPGETRANLAVGGQGIAQPLSKRDQWICEQVAPTLVQKGLTFVGLDVIGDYLTEINVTSPTCVRELDEQCGLSIAHDLLDDIEERLTTR
ncbi:MAG: glutathione synthase [Gammaproteobacteria bacterium]